MPIRPTDEEFARHAAKHSLHPEGQPSRPERIESLKPQGVTDEKSLADHTQKVMQANDTKCFRGANGRECYANDRMNTIVRTHELQPEKSTVHHNDDPTRTASQRLEVSAKRERQDFGIECEIRTGGSKALEQDRVARPVEQKTPNRADQTPTKAQDQPATQPNQPKSQAAPAEQSPAAKSQNPYSFDRADQQKDQQGTKETTNPYSHTKQGDGTKTR